MGVFHAGHLDPSRIQLLFYPVQIRRSLLVDLIKGRHHAEALFLKADLLYLQNMLPLFHKDGAAGAAAGKDRAGVRHGSRGAEDGRLFSRQGGGQVFQPVGGSIFPAPAGVQPSGIAQLRLRNRLQHRPGGQCNGIAH